jgi:hypothetical protein
MESQRDHLGRAHIAPWWNDEGGGDDESAQRQGVEVARSLPCRKPVQFIGEIRGL